MRRAASPVAGCWDGPALLRGQPAAGGYPAGGVLAQPQASSQPTCSERRRPTAAASSIPGGYSLRSLGRGTPVAAFPRGAWGRSFNLRDGYRCAQRHPTDVLSLDTFTKTLQLHFAQAAQRAAEREGQVAFGIQLF